jgi:YjbE family integral membrane protein
VIDAAAWIFLLVQIFFVDLLLGADNAIVIALACRRLPSDQAKRAVLIGAAGAITLRLGMVLFANALLGAPLVKLAGAWLLVVIALNVRTQKPDDDLGASKRPASASDFAAVAAVIMLADAAMSLDNVVALAAISDGDFLLLAIGVLLSIPILTYGALILTHLIRRAPEILAVGAAFLGWIAGGMAVSDPLLAGWIGANAPALAVFAPGLVAVFVLIAGQGAETRTAQRWPETATMARPVANRGSKPAPAPLAPSSAIFREVPQPTIPLPAADGGRSPALGPEAPTTSPERGWSEERVVVAGIMLLAFIAGLIIFIASFFDSLT